MASLVISLVMSHRAGLRVGFGAQLGCSLALFWFLVLVGWIAVLIFVLPNTEDYPLAVWSLSGYPIVIASAFATWRFVWWLGRKLGGRNRDAI